jgi:hypothetical protein
MLSSTVKRNGKPALTSMDSITPSPRRRRFSNNSECSRFNAKSAEWISGGAPLSGAPNLTSLTIRGAGFNTGSPPRIDRRSIRPKFNFCIVSSNHRCGLDREDLNVKAPLIITGRDAPIVQSTVIDRGREVTAHVVLVLGPRAAVGYAPFRSRKEFLQQFVDRLPTETMFSDKSLSYYITVDTRHAGVLVGDDLKKLYPEQITLVLQNAFRNCKRMTMASLCSLNSVESNVRLQCRMTQYA